MAALYTVQEHEAIGAATAVAYSPFISVIVPVYNDAEPLRVLLGALAEQDYPHDRFECVVIDNGSQEPIRVHDDFPFAVRVLREDRPGSYAARNRGIRAARGDVLAFTDADCIPRPDWLSRAAARLQTAARPAIVGGKVEVFSARLASASVFEQHSLVNDLDQARYVSVYHFAATANLITTRAVFDQVGEFAPTLFSGGDFEWGRRAWAVGVEQVFEEEALVRHPTRTTWRALAARNRRLIGGQYTLRLQAGQGMLAIMALLGRMTWAGVKRSWHDPRLPTTASRLQVMAVDGALRFCQLCEVVRLWFGGQPLRQ